MTRPRHDSAKSSTRSRTTAPEPAAGAQRSQLLLADLVLPVDEPPIPDGAVWVVDGRIASVGPRAITEAVTPASVQRRRFADAALIPGFVNTHAHLELSSMVGQIPRPVEHHEDFTDWIKHVLEIRETWGPAEFDASGRLGARLLLQAGTTTIGDVSASGTTLGPLIDSGIRAIIFREVLGMGTERENRAFAVCDAWMDQASAVRTRSGGRVSLALSPHAPHSTSPNIYRYCAKLSGATGTIISSHISETREEIELIHTGEGPFRKLLQMRGMPVDEWKTPGVSPVQYLFDLGVMNAPGLGIHLNYLLPGDISLLARSLFTPVYCPQSHRFLGHKNHPAGEMIRNGLPLALGTDSLASNDSLDMLDELRLLRALFPEVTASRGLAYATIGGAKALGMDLETGSLTPGKSADLAVVALAPAPDDTQESDAADPLLRPGSRVIGTMVEGDWLFEGDSDPAALTTR